MAEQPYATQAELEAYASTDYQVPGDAARLLVRASELIYQATLTRAADAIEDAELAALSNATCAQVEYWLDIGEGHDIAAGDAGESIKIGSLTYPTPPRLAPRAARHLLAEGLLYRAGYVAP